MIRALKGRSKVTKRVKDIFVENLLWPGADFIEKWARLNEDKKIVWSWFDFFSYSAAGCIVSCVRKSRMPTIGRIHLISEMLP